MCLVLCVLMCLGAAVHACAGEVAQVFNASGCFNLTPSIDPMENEEGYSAVLYDNRNGLPTSEANAIAQTSEGFIWIGSYAGLIRYDGNTFELVDSESGILNTRCLYVDRKDRLWIGTNDCGIYLMDHGSVTRIDREGQLMSESIRAIAEDTKGRIYIGTAAGVATVTEIGENLRLNVIRDEPVFSVTMADLRAGHDGLMYGLTMGGDLVEMKDGRVLHAYAHEALGIGSIQCMLPDPVEKGKLYVACANPYTGGAVIFHGRTEDEFDSADLTGIGSLANIERMEVLAGELWICAGNGIGKLDVHGLHVLKNVPMDQSVGHVMTDYEGNLWFTSSRQCVMKIVPNRFLELFERCGLPEDVVNTTCLLDGRLFIGTDNSGLVVVENGRPLKRLPLTKAETASGLELGTDDLVSYLKEERIRSIIRDSQDRLWICTWRYDHGLLLYDHGSLTAFTMTDGMLSDQVRTVCECEDGSILAAQPDGVSIIRGGRVTASYGAEDEMIVTSILTLAEGFHGEKLLGSDGGGIYVLTEGGMRHIGTKDGLKSEVILRIKRSPSRDLYWIATGNSLAFMTPDFQVTTIEHFPFSNNYDFYESSRGDLWVLSSNGIYVCSVEKLLKNGAVDAVFYGIPSGLPYIATTNSFSELTPEGDLYMAGTRGTVRVNINEPFQGIHSVKVGLPYIEIDGKRVYEDGTGVFTIPYNTRRLTIYPFVFNYSLMDPDVTYRLEGFDLQDTTVRRTELKPVSYTNLEKGTYDFVMTVRDPLGAEGLTASFRILKEKSMSEQAAGTIIIDNASLLLLLGLLLYSSMQRKRGRVDDRLFFGMVITCMAASVLEMGSILPQDQPGVFMGALMVGATTLMMGVFAVFPYLYVLYLDYVLHQDLARIRRLKVIYAIPCIALFVLLIMNLQTGWVFTESETNTYVRGPIDGVIFLPIAVYLVIGMIKAGRMNPRVLFLGALLLTVRFAWDLWQVGIPSTAFIYTLFLLCTHIHAMNKSAVPAAAEQEAPSC